MLMMMQDGYGIMFSSIFFMMLVIICSYFLLNLTVAIMLDNFKQINDHRTCHFNEQYEYNRHRVKLLKDLDVALGSNMASENSKKKFWLKSLCNKFCCKHPGDPNRKVSK